ncbi:RNA-binding protein 7 [Rana temporaria]|uniref:RNA-binding protein 7 n=1 Tax=Rana temporaria TaxID=8407 RepID=UPI001AAC668C|nr:RNA-binding protein 7 [Rana temporaria]XP_040181368.1 RNA-binding protein 7 [Rana temporaria]XP_040181369.1 RNA-binding protein 7 [Rana temporaria]
MGGDQADRTLYVGNLHPKSTEELLFELFLQAGPVANVKIPKDKDGNTKPFAFVNFKHEESVPYAMSLLNGIKLFGRQLKLQYRSGSTHVTQDTSYGAQSPQGNGHTSNGSRHEDLMNYSDFSPGANYQRSFSSPPDNLQRQAMMNNLYKQESSWYSPTGGHSTPQRYDSPTGHSRGSRNHPHESYNRDMHRVGQEDSHYRSHGQEDSHYRSHGQEDSYYRSRGQEDSHYRSRGQDMLSPYPRKDSRWGPSHH